MNYVSAENLTKSYGIKTLFENISFNINEGDKIAIVAKNGSGKSTLLKILLGKEIADSGNVVINKDIQVVLFDQEIEFNSDLSIDEFMMTLDSPPILALKNTIMLWFLTILKKWKKPSPKWKSKKLGI
jgi:ATP-binding cassette subfamily F protein uup